MIIFTDGSGVFCFYGRSAKRRARVKKNFYQELLNFIDIF